ncbi:unnamed protein product [Eruca vesicaria subsp. sativa]|uniref:Cation/H+ exchanger domain-containing protein n=1 Tax=Eruca vesicaria subsp. sativa TaxID=29727 RepID=A0ABC8KQQ9_ERUVS|nr:unnamed protein product [Eruca vesicaria subsp. sativa]
MGNNVGVPDEITLELKWVNDLAWYGEAVRPNGSICEMHPPKLYSNGIWEKVILNQTGLKFWQYRLTSLEIVLLFVFVLWQVFAILFKKLGLTIPKFTSMMLAGILLNMLVTFSEDDTSIVKEVLFPKHRIDIPGCLGSFGFMIFWFLNGVKTDLKRIFKADTHARLTGLAAATLPITVGLLLYKYKSPGSTSLKTEEYDGILLMESLTSFSEIARLLLDLGMNNSSVGQVALSAALVSNMAGLSLFLVLVPLGMPSLVQGVVLLVEMALFVVIVFCVVRPILFRVIKRKREGMPIDDKHIYWILVFLCSSCVYWAIIGQLPALGAFFLGLAIPNGPPIGSALVERLESFNFGLILPVFMTSCMLRTDLKVWKDVLTFNISNDKKLAVVSLVLLIFLLKLSISMVIPYLFKMPLKDCFILSLIMSHKGIIEISFYVFSFGLQLLDRDTFSILVLSILLNSLFLPMAIRFLYDPSKQFMCYQKRSLVTTKINGALRTLVCIHRPDHISSMINLLEASHQSEESLLTCYVLHLVELQGQDVPTLVSHKVQKLGVGTGTESSENVILSFEHFNRYICSSISIDTFTCKANSSHMQNDICWLALDKAVTLIILPFHRTWSLDRTSIVSDSEMIRFVNFNVLKQAPCSVAVLIERHLVNKKQDSQKNLKVCLIFVGGKDDMEALAFAKRMALQENVTLTVLCLVAAGKSKGWDQMLDTGELKELILNDDPGFPKEESSTVYLEEKISDGAGTSMLLRSMASDYDLFIVGRTCGVNHAATRGIEGWCEFEELDSLGGSGDMFPRMGADDLGVDVHWVYEMAWYGEAIRSDGFICEEHPAKLSSDGIWEKIIFHREGLRIWQYRLPNLELVILFVFFLWQFFNLLFRKMGLKMPKFTSMMLAGLVFNVLLTYSGNKSFIQELLFPKNKIDIPGCLGSFGFMIFWFLKGVKMDVKRILKAEAKARVTGIAAVMFPILVGTVLYSVKAVKDRALDSTIYAQLLLVESITSFSGIARLLRDLNMNHSSLGRVALSAALISDMIGLFFMIAQVPYNSPNLGGAAQVIEIAFFMVICFAAVRPLMFTIIKRKREGRPIDDKYIYMIIILVCLACMYWHDIDQFPALGAFFLGLSIPNGPPIGSELVERLESFNFGLVLPLFVTSSMLRADLRVWKDCFTFFRSDASKFAVASLIVLVFLLKFSVTVIVPYLYKMPLRHSFTLGFIMCHKGVIELSFYLFSYGIPMLNRDTFSIIVLSIVLNSLIIPIGIGFLYDPTKQFLCYQKRNIASMKNKGELKTLVCIHRPDHISSMINLLEASYQSEESPLTCYVLHLVELQGQDVPTLISHKVQKLGVGSGKKYSENVILSFEHFHRYVCSSISIDTFTCIANTNHMQDDICWLALDKAVTLIILPFHRTWSLDRTSIVSDNEMIRFLNFNVLKQAPCSVGILVERHLVKKKQESQENLKVCVIFVGGKDDREALAFAKRMARQENVILTVVRLLASGKSKETTGWDQMLDNVELRECVRSNETEGTVNEEVSTIYLEQEIIDGADTSMLLRSMAFDYDLFIVGRTSGENHEATKGIEDWCEFEELGVIGDFLASPDFPSKTSVLVVQQQRTVANN